MSEPEKKRSKLENSKDGEDGKFGEDGKDGEDGENGEEGWTIIKKDNLNISYRRVLPSSTCRFLCFAF